MGAAPAAGGSTLPERCATAAVPPLLLQPLVENASSTASSRKSHGGRIEVERAARRRRGCVLTVRDTGVGLAGASVPGTRFGLEQVRERLARCIGGAASLALDAAPTTAARSRRIDPLPAARDRDAADARRPPP